MRLLWRLSDRAPPLPPEMPAWERMLAQGAHALLYLLMFLTPLSGWVVNSAANVPLKVFGWFRLPALAEPSKLVQTWAEDVHLACFWLLTLLLVGHVGAALRHHFFKRDLVLRRMLPSAAGRSEASTR